MFQNTTLDLTFSDAQSDHTAEMRDVITTAAASECARSVGRAVAQWGFVCGRPAEGGRRALPLCRGRRAAAAGTGASGRRPAQSAAGAAGPPRGTGTRWWTGAPPADSRTEAPAGRHSCRRRPSAGAISTCLCAARAAPEANWGMRDAACDVTARD